MKSPLKVYGIFGAIVLFIVGWAIFFHFVSPETLVDKIGIKNSYIVAFVVAVIAGFSSFTGTSFYVTIAALSNGGAHPIILGLVGGVGLFISDSIFYYVACRGKKIIEKHLEKLFRTIKKFVDWLPDWGVYTSVFICSAFIPIPNDIFLSVLVASDYEYKKFAPFLFAGNIVLVLILTHIAQ
jgi:hypothetical protein